MPPLHVDYVTDDAPAVAVARLLEAVLSEPLNLALFGAGAVGAVLAFLSTPWLVAVPDVDSARRTLSSYRPYLPWMLRLSLGLPLVGAGFAGYLFSPVVEVPFRLPQILLGFALLFGLATRLAAVVGLVLYLAVLVLEPRAFLAAEYVGGFLAIALLGAGQPSADGMIRRVAVTEGTYANRLGLRRLFLKAHVSLRGTGDAAGFVLRLFLGLNFVYLGLTQKLLNGGQAMAVVEKYGLAGVLPLSPEMWVVAAGLSEVLVGLLLVVGLTTRGVATVAFVLFTTTLFALPDDPVLAHVSLFGLSSALMVTGSGRWAADALVFSEDARDFAIGPLRRIRS